MSDPKLTVFEAAHPGRREAFIGLTRLAMIALIERLRSDPPPEVPRWVSEPSVAFRSLEFNVPPADADAVVRRHAGARPAWVTVSSEHVIR
jgi:hypothetical protein